MNVQSIVLNNGYELCVEDSVVAGSRIGLHDIEGGSILSVDQILVGDAIEVLLSYREKDEGVTFRLSEFERLIDGDRDPRLYIIGLDD